MNKIVILNKRQHRVADTYSFQYKRSKLL